MVAPNVIGQIERLLPMRLLKASLAAASAGRSGSASARSRGRGGAAYVTRTRDPIITNLAEAFWEGDIPQGIAGISGCLRATTPNSSQTRLSGWQPVLPASAYWPDGNPEVCPSWPQRGGVGGISLRTSIAAKRSRFEGSRTMSAFGPWRMPNGCEIYLAI